MSDLLQWKLKGTNVPFTTSRLVKLPCSVKVAQQKLKEECGLQHVSAVDFVLYLAQDESAVLPESYVLDGKCDVLVARCKASEARELLDAAEQQFKSSNSNIATKNGFICEATISPTTTPKSLTGSEPVSGHSDSSSSYDESPDSSIQQPMESQHYAASADTMRAVQPGKISDSGKSVAGDSPTDVPNEYDEVDDEEPASYSDEGSESDEDSRIQAIMQERDLYGGETADSLSRRYYRNRKLEPSETEARVAAVVSKVTRPQAVVRGYFDTSSDVVTVDENYICHMCGQRGHHIKNCSLQEGKRQHKKIRPATGIPVDFLQVINEDDITIYDEVYQLKTGEFAVMKDMSKVSGGAFFTKSADQRIQNQLGLTEIESKNMVRGLRCNICDNFFNDPVTTLCCGESFCLDCIIDRSGGRVKVQLSKLYNCPKCHNDIRFTDIQVNSNLKGTIEALVLRKEDMLKSQSTSEETKRPFDACNFRVDLSFLKRQKEITLAYLANNRR
ncbi:E3 ubiquitin-protein ligase RBBP6 [Babesia sp. Xinjiang]|uniref:E3 ubiquitin-protein ligase RBBP6 n=1 Tax=Babesia sp. Xinjiang TaxID=462227 RepID=UPI000A2592AF|nr:E3 ubiquitin-protein ligase RBBP6 [Babesia sp. Xinjiang]ORM41944.1 E3 ubiquitin-protein ligase RBBP6 [Babesia sp. Xinjiang]